MPVDQSPLYLDWQFWAAIVAGLALVLSQLPPIKLWFLPRKLDVEVHSRLRVAHWIGNPHISLFTSIRNTGGRSLRIKTVDISITRDGEALGLHPAQNYYEKVSDHATVLFLPFTLQPGDSWEHGVNFYKDFERATEKSIREHISALTADINGKLESKPESDKEPVVAEQHLVDPFKVLFDRLFFWIPGEYVVELRVGAEPGGASFTQKYRFTLFESDTSELRSYVEDYKLGGGLMYNTQRHIGIFVPLQPHNG